MFLEQLRDFEWYNEPADVSFDERGMRVLSRARTDFWQSCLLYTSPSPRD